VAVRALADRALALSVARHKAVFFPEKGAAGDRIDYEAAVSGGLQLVPTPTALEALADDCARMAADGMQHGRPSAARRRCPAAMSVHPPGPRGQSMRPGRGTPDVKRRHNLDLSPIIRAEQRQTAPAC